MLHEPRMARRQRGAQQARFLASRIVRLAGDAERFPILETRGYDLLKDVKSQAAERWVRAVNADGGLGVRDYAVVSEVGKVGELVHDAWEAGTARERIRLARQALALSELCADAHVLLAENAARTIVEARDHYRRGVAAGEKALGPEAFERDAGTSLAIAWKRNPHVPGPMIGPRQLPGRLPDPLRHGIPGRSRRLRPAEQGKPVGGPGRPSHGFRRPYPLCRHRRGNGAERPGAPWPPYRARTAWAEVRCRPGD